MKGLFKFILFLLVIVILLAIAAAVYIFTQGDSLVERVMEEQGSAVTGSTVAVDSVALKLLDGSGAINGLSVANPNGFSEGAALQMGQLALAIDIDSLTQDVVVIDNVTITGTRVALEQTTDGNNLQALMDNIQSFVGDSGESSSSESKVIINKLTIEDTQVSVSLPQAGEARTVTIPPVVVTDIGRATNGATAAQIARQVLDPLLDKAMKSAVAEELKGRVDDKLDEAKDKLKGRLLDKLGG